MNEQNENKSLGRRAVDTAKDTAKQGIKRKIKKAAMKKIIATTVATGGGCLIPVVIILLIVIFTGWLSAFTLNMNFNYDQIKESAMQSGQNIKDSLFRIVYKNVGDPNIFTDQVLDAMVFDRKSIKTMLNEVEEYNSEQLVTNLSIKFSGYYHVSTLEKDEKGETITKITKKNCTTRKRVAIDDSWLRETYPVDWQIVYLLCYYSSLDEGEESQEVDENGVKIRLKKKYIEQVIEDVSAVHYDIGADYTFSQKRLSGGGTHDLYVGSYDWGTFNQASQEDIRRYGASTSFSFTESGYYFKFYSGYIPVTMVSGVQTLTTYERYRYIGTHQRSQVIYDTSKLEGLLEEYGNGRDMETFLFALEQLPGGAELAAEIEYAVMKCEQAKGKAGK